MLSIAAGPPGEHFVTVRVAPENLGPVTVRARIGADGVRIELFAPTDVGRAAVQAVLAELRRDLAGTGLGASLDLSQHSAPSHDPAAHDPAGRGGHSHDGAYARGGAGTGPAPSVDPDEPQTDRSAPATALSAIRLDILA
jgi:hypothetical protein